MSDMPGCIICPKCNDVPCTCAPATTVTSKARSSVPEGGRERARLICKASGCEACQEYDPAVTCYDRLRIEDLAKQEVTRTLNQLREGVKALERPSSQVNTVLGWVLALIDKAKP